MTATARSSRLAFVLALVVGLALIVVLTYPLVPGLLHWGRIDSGDGRYSIWNVGWIDPSLAADGSGAGGQRTAGGNGTRS